ncbi:hypothetical protein WOB96_01740 [Thermithiobacillus plumbiphilus]|uniref:Uncharacterized protein n=1 Tax=Thermithiobacillus plumbiphilus TaxID=1729899 RepID=A0ABU9D4J0_9PROT
MPGMQDEAIFALATITGNETTHQQTRTGIDERNFRHRQANRHDPDSTACAALHPGFAQLGLVVEDEAMNRQAGGRSADCIYLDDNATQPNFIDI